MWCRNGTLGFMKNTNSASYGWMGYCCPVLANSTKAIRKQASSFLSTTKTSHRPVIQLFIQQDIPILFPWVSHAKLAIVNDPSLSVVGPPWKMLKAALDDVFKQQNIPLARLVMRCYYHESSSQSLIQYFSDKDTQRQRSPALCVQISA